MEPCANEIDPLSNLSKFLLIFEVFKIKNKAQDKSSVPHKNDILIMKHKIERYALGAPVVKLCYSESQRVSQCI